MKLWLSEAIKVALVPDLLPKSSCLNRVVPGDLIMVMAWDQIRLWLDVFGKQIDSDILLCSVPFDNHSVELKGGDKMIVRFHHVFKITKYVYS
jgi:hypothetical protein